MNATSTIILEPPLRRGRWLKRGAIVATSLCAIAVGLRLIAGAVAERRDQAFREMLRAKGFADRMETLQPPAVPASRNAALLWTQAFAAQSGTTGSPTNSRFTSETLGSFPPYTAQWRQLAASAEAADAPAFAIASSARTLPNADWGLAYDGANLTASILSTAGGNRRLANGLADSIELALINGDDQLATERMLTLLALSRHLRVDPILVIQLSATAIDVLACNALRKNVASLDVAAANEPPSPGRASPDQVRQIILELLRPEPREGLRRSLAAEVTWQLGHTNPSWRASGWVLDPIQRRRELTELQAAAAASDLASSEADLAAAVRRADAIFAKPDGFGTSSARATLNELLERPAFKAMRARIFGTAATVTAHRQVAAMALAVRWYQCDHGGTLPRSLDALVPAYLPAVPPNPLSPRGTPYEYVILPAALPDGRDRPVLYVDMKDGRRGTPAALPEIDLYFGGDQRSRGRVSDLTSWTPTQAQIDASTQPVQ